jgi:hypothetical protein
MKGRCKHTSITTEDLLGNGFFLLGSPRGYKTRISGSCDRTEGVSWDGSRRWLRRDRNWQSVEFRDASLPGYVLGSRGVQLRNWGIKIIEISVISWWWEVNPVRVTWSRWRPFRGGDELVQCRGMEWVGWRVSELEDCCCSSVLGAVAVRSCSWGTGIVRKPRVRRTSAVGSHYQATAGEETTDEKTWCVL